jgi:hypothetical protein
MEIKETQDNQKVVHEIMETLREAVTTLLPDAWMRRWTEPTVDAEALVRVLADSVEDLWTHVDALVVAVQRQELSPEDAIAQARDHLIATIHELLPTVEVRSRLWRSRKIGTLVELAAYQVTLDRLLGDLRVILRRIARSSVTEDLDWRTFAPVPDRLGSASGWDGPRPRVWQSPISSRWSVASAPMNWEAPASQSQREAPSSGQALRRIRVTRRLLVDGQVVREDVAEGEVPFALNEEAAVAAVEAHLPPYRPDDLTAASEPAPEARTA